MVGCPVMYEVCAICAEGVLLSLSYITQLGQEFFIDANDVVVKVIAIATLASEQRDEIVPVLRDAFRAYADNQNITLPNVTGVTTPPVSSLVYNEVDLRERAQEVIEGLEELGTFILDPANELSKTLDEGTEKTGDLHDRLVHISWGKVIFKLDSD
jgi:hypothetical protein